MIKRLKRKFTVLATVASFVLMTVLVSCMNLINYASVVSEADTILNVLAQPDAPFFGRQGIPEKPPQNVGKFIPRGMSPEVPYEARYFTAAVNGDGSVEEPDVSRIVSVDGDDARDYVQKALEGGRDRGFVGHFRYAKIQAGGRTNFLFLDCGRRLDRFRAFMLTSVTVGLLGCVAVFAVFLFASGRIVRPIAESYEKQRRFVTDAGHEIKTPLTVIGANLDLLEADGGTNECLVEIRMQTERLAALTGDLVYLSRMEEETPFRKIAFPASDLIAETAQSFRAVALAQGKEYRVEVEPSVTLCGSPDAIRRLTSVLLDNAMKYSPTGGTVTLRAAVRKKALTLLVTNTVATKLAESDLPHLFDRFYRTDASRNSETGGHGIGLSVAQAIVSAHGGRIGAEMQEDGRVIGITAVLPL